ncbi:YopX family protein [Streptococcus hyovaginalis]|uniref:YopX family protein n=1 Tax=Streptococcus hyovaginalis TaxID=149015 RepID=UPI00147942B6|nr:YopX family protein [Streptococcus hyovaginalis]
MTVPKFRAWDTFDGDMVNDIFFSWQDCGYESLNECLSDERWRFMQSTGLKDQNGIEIFASDVVSWIDNGILHFGVVEFTKGMFLVNGVDPISEEMEIIGNTYEHPELAGD